MPHNNIFVEICNQSQDLLFCQNLDSTEYEFISPSSLEVIGYSPEFIRTLTPEQALQQVHPDYRDLILEAINKAIETGESELEYPHKVADGNYRWMSTKMKVTRLEGILYRIGTLRDISAYKEKERELSELYSVSNRRLAEIENMYENLPVGLCLLDLDLRFIRINKTLAEMNGISVADHINKPLKEILPNLYDFCFEVTERIIKTGKPWLGIELVGTTPAQPGVRRSWEENWLPVKDSSGEILGFSVLVIETTEKKKSQEKILRVTQALQKSQKRLKMVLSQNEVGLWERDLRTDKVIFDKKMLDLYGIEGRKKTFTFSEAFSSIYHEDQPYMENVITKSIDSGDPFEVIYRIEKDKDIKYISARGNVIRDQSGKSVKLVGIAIDVTEMQKRVEKIISDMNLELLRSNTDLQQFAYVASHDLQEPLRMVSSFTQLLQHKYGDKLDSEALEYIQFAVDGSKRMYEMINGLLALSRINSKANSFSEVDMNNVVDYAKQNLLQKINQSKAEITFPHLPVIMGDAGQLIQVVQNLIDNAIKFSEGIPRIEISYTEESEKFVFSVRDHGKGIDKKYFEKIFKMFQRLHTGEHYQGVGIGLAVCKRVIERHKGDFWVESDEGKGSTFSFSIPK